MEEIIFKNRYWMVSREHNTLWIDKISGIIPSYGETQSAIICDSYVLYDWPEYLPEYIKRICSNQKQAI